MFQHPFPYLIPGVLTPIALLLPVLPPPQELPTPIPPPPVSFHTIILINTVQVDLDFEAW